MTRAIHELVIVSISLSKDMTGFRIFRRLPGFLLLLLVVLGTSQGRGNSRFRQITMADGLSNARVFSVLQDHQGYMWFATEDGLDRYDGYTITLYKNDPANPSSVSSNLVRVLYEDKRHQLWIGTSDGGLNLFDPNTDSFKHFRHIEGNPDTLSSDDIWSITGTADGKLLVGTFDAGLDLLDPANGKVVRYPHDNGANGPSSNQINAIVPDRDGWYWIATQTGLDRFEEKTGKFIHCHNPAFNDEIVRSIAPDRKGRLWLATNEGLQWIASGKESIHKLTDLNSPVFNSNLSAIFVSSKNDLWIGSVDSGIYVKRSNSETYLKFKKNTGDLTSLSSNSVWSIYQDKSDLIWISTDDGVNILDPGMEDTEYVRPLLIRGGGTHASDKIGAVLGDKNAVWISSTAGIYTIPTSPHEKFGQQPQFLSPVNPSLYRIITALRRLDNNNVLATTATDWLLKLNNKGIIVDRWKVGADIHLHNLLLGGIIKQGPQSVYLSSYGSGLLKYNLRTGKTTQISGYGSHTLSKNTKILEFIKSKSGGLFIAALRGFFHFDPITGDIRQIALNIQGHSPEPISLYLDQHKHLWVGTIRGLWRLTLDSDDAILSRKYYAIDNNSISGIEPDRNGNLWLAGDRSIIRFNPDTGSLLFIGSEQNLPVSGFYAGSHAHTADGWLWFGGPDGLIGFDPIAITDNSVPPHVVISSISVYRDKQTHFLKPKPGVPLKFQHGDSLISFDLAVLDYGFPVANTFSYRLVGTQSEWSPPSTNHQIIFPNLEPGKYQLEVRGANNWGVWGKQIATLDIDVLPPWWRTWWAYSLYILIVLGAMLLYVHTQQRKLRKEREISARLRDADVIKSNFVHELETQVSNATADLKNTLESVNLKNQELEIAHRRASEGEQIKSQFLANMSHELRTPLTAILGYLKLLQQTHTSGEQTEYLRTVQHSAESLLAIINDTLDLSRIESGKLLIDEVDFDLLELIESAVELLGPSAYLKRLRIIRIIPPEIPLQLRGDPLRIRQILTNLVGNAIKFTQSGSICIRVQELERRDKDVILGIAISDTGIGIPASAIKHLFSAYIRHESDSYAQVEGTGLGLSICKKLLDLMGGEIEVLSTPGVGTTFEFRLAFRMQKHPAPRQKLARPAGIGLLDGHPLSHQAWHASLSRLGCEVTSIRAFTSLAEWNIDLLIIVPALEDIEKIDEKAMEMGGIAIPHMVLAPTAEPKILERVAEACRCRTQTTLIRESQLLSELQSLIPIPVSSSENIIRSATTSVGLTGLTESDSHRPLILVADDNAINRKLLVTLLLQNQYRVMEAASGEELLELAARESWDAALVDIHMPDMDGMEATQKLRAIAPDIHPPVIAISADALPETRARAHAAGMTDYLVKPYSEEQLVDVLQKNLPASITNKGTTSS